MNCRNSAFAERLLLPVVDADTLALHNRLQRRRAPLQVPFNGAALTLSAALPAAPLPADAYAVWFASADLHGCLRVAPQLLDHLLGNPALAAVFDSLAATAQAVLLEQAVLPLLAPLEALLEQPLTLSVLREPVKPLPLGFTLGVSVGEGEATSVAVELNVVAAHRVADWLDRWLPGQPQPLPALQLTAALHAGWQTLTLNEARSLNPGDVLMLEVPPGAELHLCLAGSRWARAVRQPQGIRLIESLGRVEPLMEYPMSQTTQEPVADTSLGDLPLTVVCQVGSLQLSLAEVQQLAEGSVLSLPDSSGDTVELLVNGRSMGRGELVRIGDGLGVRLTRFARL